MQNIKKNTMEKINFGKDQYGILFSAFFNKTVNFDNTRFNCSPMIELLTKLINDLHLCRLFQFYQILF